MNNNPVNYVDPWGLAGLACDKGQLLDRLEYNRRGVENLPNFLGNCIVQLANGVKATACYAADVASNPSRVVDDMKNVAKGTVYLAQNPQILGGAVQNIQTYESLPSLFVGGGLLKGGKIGRLSNTAKSTKKAKKINYTINRSPNKINHIFNNSLHDHKLSSLIKHLGSSTKVFDFMSQNILRYVRKNKVRGIFETTQRVNGSRYTIRGFVTDSGRVDINTIFLSP